MQEKVTAAIVCVIVVSIITYAAVFGSSRARQSRDVKQTIIAQQVQEKQQLQGEQKKQKEQIQKIPMQARRVKEKHTTDTLKQDRVYRRYNKITVKPKEIPSKIKSFSCPGLSWIECISYIELLKKLEYEAGVQMMTAEEFEAKKTLLPLHGIMYVESCSSTIGAANLKWWSVIIEQDGKRLLKKDGGTNSIPSFRSWSSGTTWWDLFSVKLPKMHPWSFEVYVIDSLMNKRHVHIVRPNY